MTEMRPAGDEQRIAAVRQEVQRLAAGVDDVRRTLWRTFGVLAGVGAFGMILLINVWALFAWPILAGISAVFFALLLALLAELLLGGCRAQLRRRLEELPPEQRREALMPFTRHAKGDTQR